jgi:hypothetical protein
MLYRKKCNLGESMEHGGREKGRKIKEKEIRGKIVGKFRSKVWSKSKRSNKGKKKFVELILLFWEGVKNVFPTAI